MSETTKRFAPGVVTGDGVSEIFRHANENNYALPAVNVLADGTKLACHALHCLVHGERLPFSLRVHRRRLLTDE